jgi:tetratricopeptide (TPR) repeat protein
MPHLSRLARLELMLQKIKNGLLSPGVLTLLILVVLIWVIHYGVRFLTATGLPATVWLVAVFGGLGGVVGGVIRSENKLRLCQINSRASLDLGVAGDIVQGLGGAAAAIFLFDGILKTGLEETKPGAQPGALLISVSFLAGAFGRTVILTAGEKLLLKAEQKAEEKATQVVMDLAGTPNAIAYTSAALETIKRSGNPRDWEAALRFAEQAIQSDPNYANAYIEKGRALKRLGKVQEALETVEEALRRFPNEAKALYNRACYRCLLRQPTSTVLADLKRAIEILPKLKEDARGDHDFDALHGVPEFDQLVTAGSATPPAAPPTTPAPPSPAPQAPAGVPLTPPAAQAGSNPPSRPSPQAPEGQSPPAPTTTTPGA